MPIITPRCDTVLTSLASGRRQSFNIGDGSIAGALYPKDEKNCIIKLAGNHSARGLKLNEQWSLFMGHWNIPSNAITPIVVAPSEDSIRKALNPKSIDWYNTNCPVSQYFSVLEVTKGDSARIPSKGSIEEKNILRLAAQLDEIRKDWGKPIGVTSWYRPPAVNAAAGGVSDSQHINGGAADIFTMNGKDYEFEDFLDRNWGGGLGYGIAAGKGFTHVDLRGGAWKAGNGSIRWNYGS